MLRSPNARDAMTIGIGSVVRRATQIFAPHKTERPAEYNYTTLRTLPGRGQTFGGKPASAALTQWNPLRSNWYPGFSFSVSRALASTFPGLPPNSELSHNSLILLVTPARFERATLRFEV